MLDSSAGSDTLDHTILLDRLSVDTSVPPPPSPRANGFRLILLVRYNLLLLVTQHLAVEDLNVDFRKVRYSVLSCLLFIQHLFKS